MIVNETNPIATYYKRGFIRGRFVGESLNKLRVTLKDLFEDNVKNGFSWQQKYPGTFDLRPDVHNYDQSFLDVLFEADIPSVLKHTVGSDYVLFHAQVRKSLPGPSYMDWHRDSYVHQGNAVGNFPPAHKIIYYPKFDNDDVDPKLKLAVGSQLRHFDTQAADLATLSGPFALPVETYGSSLDQYVLFNTSILHGVAAENRTSIRVIYSFMRKIQFLQLYSDQKLHAEQVKMYERLAGI